MAPSRRGSGSDYQQGDEPNTLIHYSEQSIRSPIEFTPKHQDSFLVPRRTRTGSIVGQGDESAGETEDDDDDDVDAKRATLLQELISGKGVSLTRKDEYEFAHQFGPTVKRCLIDGKVGSSEKTLLHYLATKLRTKEFDIVSIQLLVKYILKWESTVLVQTGGGQNTPLHAAISNRQFDLIRFICGETDSARLSAALEVTNERNQTCLHVAMEAQNFDIDIIRLLVEKSNSDAISKQRSRIDNPNVDRGNRNTALHDYVHIERCLVNTRTCPVATEECKNCQQRWKPIELAVAKFEKDYIDTFEMMATKCPAAVYILNDAGESPYLYHCSTRARTKHLKKDEWRGLEFLKDANAQAQNAASKGETTSNLTEREARSVNSVPHRKEAKAADKINVASKTERQAGPQLPDGTQQRRPHTRPENRLSKPLATEIARRLLEHSLSQPSYQDTYTSLFGKRPPRSDLAFKAAPLTEKTQVMHTRLPLEKILSYVELWLEDPPMDPASVDSDATNYYSVDPETREKLHARDSRMDILIDFFIWLRETMEVERIVKLVVRDNQSFPCTDETIEKCLEKFDIRYLDWNKNDICIQTLQKHTGNLRELWVSWSGRNSTLFGWLNKEHGLKCFKQLKTLHFTIDPGREPEDRNQTNIETFVRLLNKKDNAPNIEVKIPDNYNHTEPSDSKPNENSAPEDSNRWMEAVRNFNTSVSKHITEDVRAKMAPVTVGLIDDGVDLRDLRSSNFLRPGWYADTTSPEHGKMNTWYVSDKGHGTQMAKLICRVCPNVIIYVGKLDTKTQVYSSVAQSAVKAIEAAVENKATIISMSWTMYESATFDNSASLVQLNSKIESEGSKGTLLYCACEDQGRTGNDEKPYPASSSTRNIKRVGSARAYGGKSEFVNAQDMDYLFPGELGAKEGISGSSAATALASGLAALVLWCAEAYKARYELVNKKELEEDVNFQQGSRMHSLFDALRKDNKFVNITGLLNDAARDPDPIAQFVAACKEKIPGEFKKKPGNFKKPNQPASRLRT